MSDYDPNRPERVVIQLSRAALERMLGGDSQLEVELRQQIAQNFAKKHLKLMVEPAIRSEIQAAVKKAIEQVIKDEIGDFSWGRYTPTVQMKGHLKTLVDEMLNEVVRESVHAKMQYLAADISNRVTMVVNDEIRAKVKQQVEAKLKEVAAKL